MDRSLSILASEEGAIFTSYQYKCLKGARLVGVSKITCQSNGKWTAAPECRKYTLILTLYLFLKSDTNMIHPLGKKKKDIEIKL